MAEYTTNIAELRRSPAEHLARLMEQGSSMGERGVRLREIPFLAMIGLRARPGTPSADALCQAGELELPTRCGQVTGDADGVAVLWLGPDEFLVIAPDQVTDVPGLDTVSDREPGALPSLSTHPLVQQLSVVLSQRDLPGQVVDVSANRTTLELAGPKARSVLEKGCHLDLHPREFPVGQAVSTVLGPVPVLLWHVSEDTYRLLPRASFTEYTVRWLVDAMREYFGPEVA